MHFYITSVYITTQQCAPVTDYASLSRSTAQLSVGQKCSCILHKLYSHLLSPFLGAGPMQAPGLFDIPDRRGKFGLIHNIGIGGAVVVTLLRRPEFYKEGGKDGRDRSVPGSELCQNRTFTDGQPFCFVFSLSHLSPGLVRLAWTYTLTHNVITFI